MNKFLLILLMCFCSLNILAGEPYKMTVDGKTFTVPFQEMKSAINYEFKEMVKEVNSQCPVPVGESMELYNMMYMAPDLVVSYRMFLDSNELSKDDKEYYREEMRKAGALSMAQMMKLYSEDVMPWSEWLRFYKEMDFRVNAIFYDEVGRIIWKIVLTYKDFEEADV